MKKQLPSTPVLIIFSGLALIAIPLAIEMLFGMFTSSETVGANIGSGILIIFAVPLIIIGLTWYGLTLKGWKRALVILSVMAIIAVLSVRQNVKENNSNRIYCQEKQQNQEPVYEGQEFCKKYL